MRHARRGFSLVELLTVIAIISILLSLLLGTVFLVWKNAQINAAKAQLSIMANALEAYRFEYGSYPPDNYPTANSSEALAYHLCRRFKKGEFEVGPFYNGVPVDHDSNGYPELWSTLKSPFHYVVTLDEKGRERGYISVDSGWDKKLGGSLDPSSGFVPDGSGDDKDNFMQK